MPAPKISRAFQPGMLFIFSSKGSLNFVNTHLACGYLLLSNYSSGSVTCRRRRVYPQLAGTVNPQMVSAQDQMSSLPVAV